MPTQKVRLNKIEIGDEIQGNWGPQRLIKFKQYLPEGERQVSAFLKSSQFKPDDWKEGKEIELEIYQKGNYWNFKIPNKMSQANAVNEESRKADHAEIMNGLRELFKKLDEINIKVSSILNT